MSKELLFSITKKDLEISHFSGTGAGGQHRNRHKNCVRLYHPDSDVRVTGQSNKELRSNIKEALNNLVKSFDFKRWHNRRVMEIIENKTIDQIVEEMMVEDNLKIEVRKDGKWEND